MFVLHVHSQHIKLFKLFSLTLSDSLSLSLTLSLSLSISLSLWMYGNMMKIILNCNFKPHMIIISGLEPNNSCSLGFLLFEVI